MLFKSLAFLTLLIAAAGPLAAGDTVAVLAEASGVYMEAFSAFQDSYGEKIPYFDISRKKPVIPPGTRTVVAFGAEAAMNHYPAGLELVYAMAPGYMADAGKRSGATVKISMLNPPKQLLTGLKELQPALKRLLILWRAPAYAAMLETYAAEGAGMGIEVSPVKVNRDEELPGLLRAAVGSADAFWLPPDPLLISESTLMILGEFSLSNRIPMYVATKGLAQKGACAAIGASFPQIGAAASDALKKLRNGIPLPPVIYPAGSQLTLNASAARRCNLNFSDAVISKSDGVFP